MIKFFRKIRQNLLSEGKTVNYLKYALGEIALVVIGILIALQINNWNEQRKLEIADLQLSKELLEDTEADSVFFQSRLIALRKFKATVSYILEKPELRVADSTILNNAENGRFFIYSGLRYLSNVVANNENAVQEIKSNAIKNELRHYSLQYDYVRGSLSRMNNIFEQEFNPFMKKYAEKLRLMSVTGSIEILNEIYNDKDFQKSTYLLDGYFDDVIKHLNTFEVNNTELAKVLRQRINISN